MLEGMSRRLPDLDHIALFAMDMDPLAEQYERLGFRLTPLSQHARPPAPGRPVELRGTGNRCAMFRRGYLELLAVVDPSLDALGVPEALERYAGMHLLAFGVDDANATRQQLREAGFQAELAHLERELDTPQGRALARFSQIRTPAAATPEARVFMIRHETPELLWQPQLLDHPNGAQSLEEVVVVTAELDAATERYRRYLGCEPLTRTGRSSFRLRHGTLTLMSPRHFASHFPDAHIPLLPFPAAVTIRTASLDTTRNVLAQGGIPIRERPESLVVAAEHAGGLTLVFRGEIEHVD